MKEDTRETLAGQIAELTAENLRLKAKEEESDSVFRMAVRSRDFNKAAKKKAEEQRDELLYALRVIVKGAENPEAEFWSDEKTVETAKAAIARCQP